MFMLLSNAVAQDMTKGTIAGVVRDPSGAVITGAKVTLETPQGERSTETNSAGEYQFIGLAAGPGYAVTAEKTGFSKGRVSDLMVKIGLKTPADFSLAVGMAATTVEVIASSAQTIDPTSTTIGATLDEKLYKNVPAGRNISAIINFSPGVVDSAGAGTANPSINGASGLENQYNIDGSDVTDPGFGGFGTYSRTFGPLGNGVNFDFVEQVQVKSGGFEAQYGSALGGVINVQTKTGGNNFHYAAYGFFQPLAFEVTRPNLNDVLTNKVTYISHRGSMDWGGNLGGYIKKDKLFFFMGVNPTQTSYEESAEASFSNAALGSLTPVTTTYNYVAKLTWSLNDRHSIDASVFGDPASSPNSFQSPRSMNTRKPPFPVDTTVMSALDYGSRTWAVRYNGAINSHWLLTANYGDHSNHFTEYPFADGYRVSDTVPSQEKTGGTYSYGGLGFLEYYDSRSHQANIGSSNVFTWLGGHNLDYGFQYENQPYNDIRLSSGGDFTIPNLPEFQGAAGKIQHGATFTRTHQTSSLTSPIVLKVTRGEYSDGTVSVGSSYTSGYMQDSWNMGRHFTAKLGLRFEQQSMFGTYSRYVFGHNWAPRVGLVFDPTGSRKSKIFANWGRFYEKIPQDISVRAFSFETSVIGALYKDQGAGNQPNLSPANYIPGGALSFQGDPSFATLVYGGTGAQYQDEYIFGYEKEFNGMTFSGRYVRRDLKRVLEDISGINATQANAGVNQQYVISNPNASLDIFTNAFACTGGLPKCDPSTGFTPVVNPLGSDGIPDGFPDPVRIYKAMELVFSKRFSKGFQFFANYTLSSLYGNYQGNFRSDNGQTDPNISSLFDFTNSDNALGDQFKPGPLPSDRLNQIKLIGSKSWKGFNFGLTWSLQSGTPISKLLDHPVYLNSGEVPVGGRGALGRTPWILPLNLHADYTKKLGEQMHVVLIADFFNVFNQTKVFAVNQTAEVSGAPGTPNVDFLKPQSYQAPFSARLGVRLEF
jgi:hypothetical protein